MHRVVFCSSLALLVPAASSRPVQAADFPGEPFVIERLVNRHRFEADGTGQTAAELLLEIQNEAGVQQMGQSLLPFVGGRERMEIIAFRVRRADGSVAAEAPARVEELPAPVSAAFPVYSDLRVLHVTAPALHAGDRLEIHLTKHLVQPEAPDQFWIQHAFTRHSIVLEEVLEVDVPASKAVRLRTAEDHPAEIFEHDGRRHYRWRHENLERAQKLELQAEPDVELGTFASWAEVGEWYRRLQGTRAEPDSKVREQAAELTRGLMEDDAKVRALYQFTSSQFRYLALLLGAGRYQPHAAGEVFANGYGDCKDKQTLFAALLAAAGFEASPVLVSTRREVRSDVPAPHQFDHMITAVSLGGELRFLDATAQVAPFGYLLPALRGTQGLLVPAAGEARLVDIPEALPFPERRSFTLEGRLDEAGDLAASVVEEIRGDDEFALRAAFFGSPTPRWPEILERALQAGGVVGEVSDLEISPLSATADPLRLTYSLSKEDWVDPGSVEEEVRAVLPRFDLPAADEGGKDDDDEVTLELGGPAEFALRSRIDLPAQLTARAPVAVILDREFARYASSYTVQGASLLAERRLTVVAPELPPDRFAEYEAFRAAIEKDGKQEFTLAAVPGTAVSLAELDVEGLRRAGSEALGRKDYAQAAAALDRLTEAAPDDSQAWYDLGRARQGAEDSEGAVAAYRRAAELDPYDERTFGALARSLDWLGDLAAAEEAYRRQLEIDPLDAVGTALLGELLAKTGQCKEAAALLARARTLGTDDCETRVPFATCLLRLDRAAEAAPLLEGLQACDDTDDLRGLLLGKLGRWSEASDALAGYVEEHPEDLDARWFLAEAEAQRRDLPAAIEQLRLIVAQDPGYDGAQSMLGALLFATGILAEAQVHLEAAVEDDVDDAAAALSLGLIYAGQQRWRDSLELLERAKRLQPDHFPDQEMLDYVRGQAEGDRPQVPG